MPPESFRHAWVLSLGNFLGSIAGKPTDCATGLAGLDGNRVKSRHLSYDHRSERPRDLVASKIIFCPALPELGLHKGEVVGEDTKSGREMGASIQLLYPLKRIIQATLNFFAHGTSGFLSGGL